MVRARRARLLSMVGAAWCAVACSCEDAPARPGAAPAASTSTRAAVGAVELVPVPEGTSDGPELLRRERARAQADGKELVVYVGAEWCEPCRYFHDAAAKGQLDRDFPTLRLLELDHDRHEAMLDATGCRSRRIPLFAIPTPEGRCSDHQLSGAIKGPGAVEYLRPKLRALLAAAPR